MPEATPLTGPEVLYRTSDPAIADIMTTGLTTDFSALVTLAEAAQQPDFNIHLPPHYEYVEGLQLQCIVLDRFTLPSHPKIEGIIFSVQAPPTYVGVRRILFVEKASLGDTNREDFRSSATSRSCEMQSPLSAIVVYDRATGPEATRLQDEEI